MEQKKIMGNCECCKKKMELFSGTQKYCSGCAIHNKSNQMIISQLKVKVKRFKDLYYNLLNKNKKKIRQTHLQRKINRIFPICPFCKNRCRGFINHIQIHYRKNEITRRQYEKYLKKKKKK